MSTLISDESGKLYVVPIEFKKHKDKFSIEPNIIGMFWSDQDKVLEGILNAIRNNTPYDEYKMLTKSEQEAFDKGELIF
jgi:hypothetical protein